MISSLLHSTSHSSKFLTKKISVSSSVRYLSLLRFVNVSKQDSNHTPVIENSGFKIEKGSKIALFGNAESGKDVLFNLIKGIETPEGGRIERAENLTVIPFKTELKQQDTYVSVKDYLSKFNTDQTRQAEALQQASLSTNINRKISTLSKDDQGKIQIAKTVLQNGDIILVDNPTHPIDEEDSDNVLVSAELNKAIQQFLKETKSTVILSSSDENLLQSVADHVLYFDATNYSLTLYKGKYSDVRSAINQKLRDAKARVNAAASQAAAAKLGELPAGIDLNKIGHVNEKKYETVEDYEMFVGSMGLIVLTPAVVYGMYTAGLFSEIL